MEEEVFSINDLCTRVTDGSHFSPENISDGIYPMYSVKDMDYNGFKKDGYKTIDQSTYDKLCKSDCRPLKNDILIAKDGSYLKYVFKTKEDLNACILSSIAILRPNIKKIDPDYFVYLLRSASVKNSMANYVSGAALPRIILKAFKKMRIKLIKDRTYQSKIGNILSTYDDLIEKNNRKIEILREMAEELYKEWFVRFRFPGYKTAKFIDGIPEGWEIDKIKNKLNRLPFNRLYKEYELENEGNVIVIDQSEKEYLGFHNNEPSHIASIEEPICLFGDHSCKFKLMCKPFSLGENVVPFKGNGINSYYLFYATHNIIETEEYKRHWGLFTSKKIIIPSEPLQIRFAEFVKLVQQQISTITQCQRLLIKQRDLLLPRLMSGKLEVS